MTASAASTLPEVAHKIVAANYTEYQPAESATGDLDGNGLPDHAVLLRSLKENGERVLVLRSKPDGGVEQFAVSRLSLPCQHGRELWIKKGSLFVTCFHSGDGSMHHFSTQQFSMRDRRLRLIGEESASETGQGATPDPKYPDTSTSINYLTGESIETKKWKGRIISRTKSKLPLSDRRPQFLDDYEF